MQVKRSCPFRMDIPWSWHVKHLSTSLSQHVHYSSNILFRYLHNSILPKICRAYKTHTLINTISAINTTCNKLYSIVSVYIVRNHFTSAKFIFWKTLNGSRLFFHWNSNFMIRECVSTQYFLDHRNFIVTNVTTHNTAWCLYSSLYFLMLW